MEPGDWCRNDAHKDYERFPHFNDWLDAMDEDAQLVLDRLGLAALKSPSKALFAGDSISYRQERARFLAQRRIRALGGGILTEHWVTRNTTRFDQLLTLLRARNIVPFVGAGISCASNYDSWSDHLLNQAKTAGYPSDEATKAISSGQHEVLIDIIVRHRSFDVFVRELVDRFGGTPSNVELARKIIRLSPGLIATTNYDLILENAIKAAEGISPRLIRGADSSNEVLREVLSTRERSLLKIHGSIDEPRRCILRGSDYDLAYGATLDMSLSVPRKLRALYAGTDLLFLGCSLVRDRVLSVFNSVRAAVGPEDIPQHFAIVEGPESDDLFPERNDFLLEIGITPIFYPAGQHQLLADIIDELLAQL